MTKGVVSIKTCSSIYLKEYVNSKLIRPIDIKPLIIPSKENKSKEFSPMEIVEFTYFSNTFRYKIIYI